MPYEKPKVDYMKGDPDRIQKAEARRQAERFGKIPEFEAQQRAAEEKKPQAIAERPDFVRGDSEKLKAARQKLEALYPKKQEATPDKEEAA